MTSLPSIIHAHLDDSSRPDTPIATLPPKIEPDSLDVPLTSATPTSNDPVSSRFLLPIPTPSGNRRSSFVLSDVVDDTNCSDPLPPEIASADISIASDGSFVETSSGLAARDLKRRYDQHFGVTASIRSPYAITAFVNQHGKQMFRVGTKDLSAPAASAAEVEQRVSQSKIISESSHSQTPRAKGRSRMSVHTLLPPSMFKNPSQVARPQLGSRNKLRKTRSIPDMSLPSSSTSVESRPLLGTTPATGRAHSHSVTGADLNRLPSPMAGMPPPSSGDMFAEVMSWAGLSSNMSFSPSTQSLFSPRVSPQIDKYDHAQFPAIIPHPFGPGVCFDSPSARPSTVEHLPPPHMLREMQSFESGLTARQNDPESPRLSRKSRVPVLAMAIDPPDRPESAASVRRVIDPRQEAPFSPLPETSMHSRYSTEVFDVLQTYRGLPRLDKLSSDSVETTVIKMSLAADETAAPRDDPRFVIWGEVSTEQESDELSISEGSFADKSMSAHSSNASRKRKNKDRKSGLPSVRVSSSGGAQKVLLAATIERWIAQLTSELNYDELLIFFLTYRTYISAVDLCHLLICRFHWALAQHTSAHDEMVRRIVRVRTFVAIRYWLLTFFSVDFLPNRELRLLVANWLNTLILDPILQKHNDGLSIARKLKKVVKDCKKAHQPSLKSTTTRSSIKPRPTTSHVLGEKFAEALATRKTVDAEDDSDVDLDFPPDEVTSTLSNHGFPSDPVNAHLSAVHVGAGLSPGHPASAPLSVLQPSNRNTIPDPALPFVQTAATLPIHHNALSRVIVKTIGRLGRWKRVLNSRSAPRDPVGAIADLSAFNLELTVSRDLLTVNGGVEQYLKMIEPRSSATTTTPPSLEIDLKDDLSMSLSSTILGDESSSDSVDEDHVDRAVVVGSGQMSLLSDFEADTVEHSSPDPTSAIDQPEKAKSFRSTSTDSLGVPVSPGSREFTQTYDHDRPFWQFDVVSIDELDLSDTSSDQAVEPSAPPGLRKLPRRLPLRRDFEFVRQSDSVSSMGMNSHDSMASTASSIISSSSAEAGLGAIQQWQMNALVDSLSNDEETGDVEAALRRLEGEINPKKQQEKASKVDVWVRTIQERLAAGDYHDDQPRFSDDEEENGPDDADEEITGSDSWSNQVGNDSILSRRASLASSDVHVESVNTPLASQAAVSVPSGPTSPLRSSDARPALEDVVPIEILKSRVPSRPSTASGSDKISVSLKPATSEKPLVHRSFILGYRAETLAEHFSMIDRELFMGVKFEELVLDDWMSCDEVDVLDWGQFLKERARWQAESRWPHKTSALAAVRARFNLIANFAVSEIVLTRPSERALVVGKFIRIAWKSYSLSNFSTLVAIIAALQCHWVNRAMNRLWNRIGMWESRMLRDLKEYCNSADDFKYIRQAVDLIADAKPVDARSQVASSVNTSGTDGQSNKGKTGSETKLPVRSACVPFIGVYLSQLRRHSKLPDLIDPTAPNEGVGVDPISANFDTPAHPEVFSALTPLIPSMQLEPLINVQKQRLIAGVIKSLVAGQHLASRIQFPIDRKTFQKCLKLRGLDSETLRRALAMYPE